MILVRLDLFQVNARLHDDPRVDHKEIALLWQLCTQRASQRLQTLYLHVLCPCILAPFA